MNAFCPVYETSLFLKIDVFGVEITDFSNLTVSSFPFFLQTQMETFSGLRPRPRWETPLHVVTGICYSPVTQHTQDRPREESQHRDREGRLAMSSLDGVVHSTQCWTVSANTMPNRGPCVAQQVRSRGCGSGEAGLRVHG